MAKSNAVLTPTEQFKEWDANRMNLAEEGISDAGTLSRSSDPMEDLERDIYAAKAGAENIAVSQVEGININRRYHNAKGAFQEALAAADNDQSKVDPAILTEYARADKAMIDWTNHAEEAARANEERDAARELRGLATDDEAIAQKMIKQALEARQDWEDAMFTKGEVREAKPPILVPSDRFDIETVPTRVGAGVISGAKGKRAEARQTIIRAPEVFHNDISKLLNSPAFWEGIDGKRTRQTLRDAGGDYADLSRRATASTDAGAWAGTQEWGQFWDLVGGKTFFFDTSVVPSIDVDNTDKIPVGAINAAPAGGWLAENGTINLSDMGTKTEELDAFCYAVASDISDKYLRNSWAQRLNLRSNVFRQQSSKMAYDVGAHFVNGTGTATAPAGLNAKIGGAARNKITGIVKATDLRASDLIELTYSVDREYRRGGLGLDKACFFGSSDVWKAIETETGTDRRINTEGEPWVQSMITYPQMTPFAESAHVNYFLRQYACIESEGFEAPATGKTTALWFGSIGQAVVVRRSSLFSAIIPIQVMIGGQTTLQERLCHWIYTDVEYVQDTTLSGKAGPMTVVQPNRA